MSNPNVLPAAAAVLLLIALAFVVVQPLHWERTSGIALVLALVAGAVALRQRRT